MAETKFNIPTWLNSILITILIIIAGATFFQNRDTADKVSTLQLQVAVLTEQLNNHITFGENGMAVVEANEKRLDVIEANYMKRDEILKQLDDIRRWVENNYVKK